MAVAIIRNPFANDFDIVSQAPPDKISDLMQNILQGEQAKMHERDRIRKMAMDLRLFANQPSIRPQLLRTPVGKMPVIRSSYADISCASLGIHGLLNQLNSVLGTSYTPPPLSLFSLLQFCVSAEYDFGTVYSLLRPRWYAESYSTTIEDELYDLKRADEEMRRQGLVNNQIRTMIPPRRVWDLHSNRVVRYCFTLEEPWAISYAKKRRGDCIDSDVTRAINGNEWPATVPKGANLDTIREELLEMGAEYVWLDVLCLRQKNGQREDLRVEEWKIDVPTIGNVYRWADVVV
ncbi:hypothetical protein ARMSODRAFT_456760 [Armillaria solidipes]|uniref:Heterokaryon incompatibility domain-containing protein n=1 Tax=Armillaria solidipes TaxID=1076256 RepID=A0A2H3B132_9AGAR|nr:hypothetical protein ARMSODRAFT_456760 [Armillaria solidipes]